MNSHFFQRASQDLHKSARGLTHDVERNMAVSTFIATISISTSALVIDNACAMPRSTETPLEQLAVCANGRKLVADYPS